MTEKTLKKKAKDVVDIYTKLENLGVKIWVDGGWSVDALLGEETRPHNDLDIAIQWKDVEKLREVLMTHGYKQIREDSKWNIVFGDDSGHEVDVHAFIYDDKGNVVEGIMYPVESLTGTGIIKGQSVSCISPKYMVEFLAPWIHKWPEKYVPAVSALCKKFSIELPKEYVLYKKGITLLDETKSSLEEVVNSLVDQKSGTVWAEKTNQFAIDYAKKLTEVYGDVWYKGFLPEELFLNIVLPKHGHSMTEKDDEVFFPLDTYVKDAMKYLQKIDPERTKECLELIHSLKKEIKENGFTSSIALAVINGKLKHVDGLHRMIALSLLLEEGYQYKPIPVFLCDSTKKNAK